MKRCTCERRFLREDEAGSGSTAETAQAGLMSCGAFNGIVLPPLMFPQTTVSGAQCRPTTFRGEPPVCQSATQIWDLRIGISTGLEPDKLGERLF